MSTFPRTWDRLNFIRNQYSSDVLLRTRMPAIARIVPGMNKRQTVLTSVGIHQQQYGERYLLTDILSLNRSCREDNCNFNILCIHNCQNNFKMYNSFPCFTIPSVRDSLLQMALIVY